MVLSSFLQHKVNLTFCAIFLFFLHDTQARMFYSVFKHEFIQERKHNHVSSWPQHWEIEAGWWWGTSWTKFLCACACGQSLTEIGVGVGEKPPSPPSLTVGNVRQTVCHLLHVWLRYADPANWTSLTFSSGLSLWHSIGHLTPSHLIGHICMGLLTQRRVRPQCSVMCPKFWLDHLKHI